MTVEKITNDSDFIVLACDGIWDCLSSQEAVNFVQEKLKQKKGRQSLGNVIEDMFENICA